MSDKTNEENFLEFIKTKKWLLPVLLIIFLLFLGSMIFLSEDFSLSPVIYSKF